MKDKNGSITWRKLFDRAFKIDPVDGAKKAKVRATHISFWSRIFGIGFNGLFQGIGGKRLLAQTHKDDINCHPVQPSGKGRFAAEGTNLTKKLEKGFLGEILSIGRIADPP